MSPLNFLINYSATLSQSPSPFSKYISSRFVTAISIPVELMAIMENMIKLPFQSASTMIKIPAKIISVFTYSPSLNAFEQSLSGPLDVLKTALKIVGYLIGTFFGFGATILSPFANFQVHYALGLITDQSLERKQSIEQERKQVEIDTQERILQARLREIVNAKQEEATLLTDEQRQEIECLTNIPCPCIKEIVEESDSLASTLKNELNKDPTEIQDLEPVQTPTQPMETQSSAPEISIDLVNTATVC